MTSSLFSFYAPPEAPDDEMVEEIEVQATADVGGLGEVMTGDEEISGDVPSDNNDGVVGEEEAEKEEEEEEEADVARAEDSDVAAAEELDVTLEVATIQEEDEAAGDEPTGAERAASPSDGSTVSTEASDCTANEGGAAQQEDATEDNASTVPFAVAEEEPAEAEQEASLSDRSTEEEVCIASTEDREVEAVEELDVELEPAVLQEEEEAVADKPGEAEQEALPSSASTPAAEGSGGNTNEGSAGQQAEVAHSMGDSADFELAALQDEEEAAAREAAEVEQEASLSNGINCATEASDRNTDEDSAGQREEVAQSTEEDACAPSSTPVSHENTSALDAVRNLLNSELKQDCALLSKFTDEVAHRERVAGAKHEEGAARDASLREVTARVEELSDKNREYAREIQRLSNTVHELSEGNQTTVGRMLELEQTVAAKKAEMEGMNEALAEQQCLLNQNMEDNTELIQHLEDFNEQNKKLQTTVVELHAKNAECVSDLEFLTISLEELIDQNEEHETKARRLSRANDNLGVELRLVQQNNAALSETIESLEEAVEGGKAREATLAADKAGLEEPLARTRAEHEAAVATADQLRADSTAALEKEKADNSAIVAELNAAIHDVTSRAVQLEDDHDSTVNAMTLEHDAAATALCQSLEAEMDVHTVLAAQVDRLTETLASAELAVLRLEGALRETNERHEEEVATMIKMITEHAAWQQQCRVRINEEHVAIMAGTEAAAAAAAEEQAASVARLIAEHGADLSEAKEKHAAALSDVRVSLAASAAALASSEGKHKAAVSKMALEQKTKMLKMKTKHMASMSDVRASLTLSTTMHRVTEGEMRQILALSRDEHKAALKEKEHAVSKQGRAVVELQGRVQETERRMSSVAAEKADLQEAVDELQKINHDFSTESSGPRTTESSEVLMWNEERETLTEKNRRLRNQLEDSQMSLVVVADENEALTRQKAALARQKDALEQDTTKERQHMLGRQEMGKETQHVLDRELELLLKHALKAEEEKENAKERSPKNRFTRLVLSARPPQSSRVPSIVRIPLSPRVW